MDSFSASLRRERTTRALLPLFFASGATALVYQTVWARQLHLVFGTSSLAITTVLAAFMAGLALGGLAMARRVDRVARPLWVYGVLELGIGAYALVFPTLLRWLVPLYLAPWRSLEPSPLSFAAWQAVLVGGALLVPTAMMGATLPLLARFATDRLGTAGRTVGLLYGVNTGGAVVGTLVAGFAMLPAWGLWATTVATAVANVAVGVAALALDAWARGAEDAPVVADVEVATPLAVGRLVPAVVFGAGFAGLAYEVAWTRVLGLVIGGSAYAFSLMLLAFLSGIAVGGAWGGVVADRVLERRGVVGVLTTLAAVELGVAATAYASMFVFPSLPYWYVWLFDALAAKTSAQGLFATSLAIAGLVMTPSTVLMGAAFPLAVRAVVRDVDALGRPVGVVYGYNTVGSVLGAALAGFVLLPWLGILGTLRCAVLVNVLVAAALLVAVWRQERRGVALGAAAVLALGALLVRPPWDPMMMTAGLYKYVSSFHTHTAEGIWKFTAEDYELIFYEEGLSAVVTVVRNPSTGNIWLANNGKVDASSNKDMPTQLLLAAAPLQHVPEPRRALVIGLASGVTAGALTLSDDLERLDVVELEPAVGRAAALFAPYNFDVLDDPRTHVTYNDGRNQLLLTPPGTYDLVISEPPNPWISGVANLFTAEFYALGKSRLRPGGVWAQWVQVYAMSRRDLGSMLATVASVYDHMLVYRTPSRNDLVVVASDTPIRPGPIAARRVWEEWPALGVSMTDAGIEDPTSLVALFQMDRNAVLGFADGAPLNTDDNMRIEYSAPLNLHRSTSEDNNAAFVAHRVVPFDAYADDPGGLAELAKRYKEHADWARAVLALRGAVAWAPDDDPRIEAWSARALLWEAELLAELDPD